ncbi:MAG: hypothetical protein LUQ60_00230 [Methanomicrobiales archaeon]|nr:hypothetical protein [Methanomicrobiales archaeon]
MNGRFAKILILVLCGALLLIAGCTTTAPSGGAAPTPAGGTTTQVSTSNADLGTITALLRTINDQVSLVAENTRPQGKGILTGTIVLFDNQGDPTHNIGEGTSVIALPQGSCDIAVYASSISTYTIIEEMKDYVSEKYTRNKQVCLDTVLCRKTVTLDGDFSYLYIDYKPYSAAKTLSKVTLSYRC